MLPNILTTVRLIIVPFFAYFVLRTDNVAMSVILFAASGLTDIIDGWIARRFDMITDVGKVYDPFVDKLTQITAVICLAYRGVVPVWVIYLVAVKEITMIVTGAVLYLKKIVVHSNWYGKTATVVFYAVILLLIMLPEMTRFMKNTLLSFLVAAIVFAAFGYLIKFVGKRDSSVFENKSVG